MCTLQQELRDESALVPQGGGESEEVCAAVGCGALGAPGSPGTLPTVAGLRLDPIRLLVPPPHTQGQDREGDAMRTATWRLQEGVAAGAENQIPEENESFPPCRRRLVWVCAHRVCCVDRDSARRGEAIGSGNNVHGKCSDLESLPSPLPSPRGSRREAGPLGG